jgi:hypothetical protein
MDFRWVDVDVHDACTCGKRLQLAGDTIVEAHTQGNHQISLWHTQARPNISVECGSSSESLQLSSDTLVKAHTQSDHQVTLLMNNTSPPKQHLSMCIASVRQATRLPALHADSAMHRAHAAAQTTILSIHPSVLWPHNKQDSLTTATPPHK